MDSGRQYIFAFIALIMLGMMGWYYARPQKISISKEQISKLPDTIISGITFTQFDKKGSVSRVMFSPHMTHYEKSKINVFEHPKITLYKEEAPPWQINARHGRSTGGSSDITLWKNVILHQAQSAENQEKTITTDELHYYPDKQFASTQKDITFHQGGLLVKSLGMNAYLERQQIELLQQVWGRYEAPPSPAIKDKSQA